MEKDREEDVKRKMDQELRKVYEGGSTDFICMNCQSYFYVHLADEDLVHFCPFCGCEFDEVEDVD